MVKYVLLSLGVVGLLVFGSGVASQSNWPASQQERFVVRVPEDFPTIQAAIDAVAEGGTVLIGPGTYKENLKISKSLRLRGASQESVRIQAVDHGGVTIDIASEKPIQVSLEDFMVKNKGFLSSSGIRVGGAVQASMERLTVSEYEYGMTLSNSSAILSSVKISHNRTGISISEDGNIIIQEASITENDEGILSIGLLGEPYLIVSRSLFFLNRVMAVGLIGGLYGGLAATLDGNQIVKNFGGVYVGKYYQPDLVRALFPKRAEPGPTIIEMYNNQITGNLLYGIAISLVECLRGIRDEYFFILLSSSSNVIFTGRDNDIKDNGKGDLCPADYPWPPGFRKP